MEKNMENESETGFVEGLGNSCPYHGFRFLMFYDTLINLNAVSLGLRSAMRLSVQRFRHRNSR